MKKNFETFAPLFPGFYGTVFECDETNEIESYNEENGTDLNYDDFEWDYRDYKNRVSKAFVNRLETELKAFLPIEIEFQNISSPREYNFENDSINIAVKFDLKVLIGLIKERKDAAEKYFKEKYTSYDGFISFHSSNVEDWLKQKYILEKPSHRIGALLDCLCSIEIDSDDIYYWCDSEYYVNYELKEKVSN